MSYSGYIARIKNIRKHGNADRLQVGEVFGNNVIVGLDTQDNDLGFYLPTDGKIGIEFAKINNLLREKNEDGSHKGGYIDPEKRNIRSIRLRGEKSDGIFLSLDSLSSFTDITTLKEGDPITILNGIVICEKYIPRGKVRKGDSNQRVKKKTPKETYPFFQEHIDTSQLAYNIRDFKEGDICHISLKLHGTSQRASYTIKEKKIKLPKMIHKALKIFGVENKPKRNWELVIGTRRVVLKDFEGGFYGSNQFRKQWHDFFEGKLHKGESIYFEVVGFADENMLIMPECNNKKTKDKEFVKQYGDSTKFTYGCEQGKSDIYAYRMTMTNEDGHTIEYPQHLLELRCEQMGVKNVPVLESFIFTTEDDLMERVKKHENGADPIGKTHIREGVVIRIENREKFTAYKQKNFEFKVLEGIIKEDDILDMEESENSKEGLAV